jgi:hypothetical protein
MYSGTGILSFKREGCKMSVLIFNFGSQSRSPSHPPEKGGL